MSIGICFTLLTLNSACKVTNNQFEIKYDQGLSEENPEYYRELNRILLEFENHLISQKIITSKDNKNYIRLLERIKKQGKKDFDITYPLSDSLNGISKLLKNDGTLSGITGFRSHLNSKESKEILFQEKIAGLINNKVEISPSVIATVMLEVYDEEDYDLPKIKTKLFKFLDPNSDWVIYIYVGKPITE